MFINNDYTPTKIFRQTFFWLPAAVHWAVATVPVLLLCVFLQVWGPWFAAISSLGSLWYVYRNILYPGDGKEDQRPILKNPESSGTQNKKLKKRRTAVIGAGPAGLVTTKELLAEGHSVVCYEASDGVGETFANHFWPGGSLVSSPYTTAFSDFEPPRREDGQPHLEHHTAEEYVDYLEAYAERYRVTKCLSLSTRVEHVFQEEDKKMWIRVVCCKTGKRTVQGPYDHVAVCSGSFNEKNIPSVRGIDSFPGKVLHTRDLPGNESLLLVSERAWSTSWASLHQRTASLIRPRTVHFLSGAVHSSFRVSTRSTT